MEIFLRILGLYARLWLMKNKGQLPNSNEIKIVDKREIRNRCLGKKKKQQQQQPRIGS